MMNGRGFRLFLSAVSRLSVCELMNRVIGNHSFVIIIQLPSLCLDSGVIDLWRPTSKRCIATRCCLIGNKADFL